MANFNVKITEYDEDIHIYTDVSKIGIKDNTIEINYEDGCATHRMDLADEIIIKANR